MISNRRKVGVSLGIVSLVWLAVWLASDSGPGGGATPVHDAAQAHAMDSPQYKGAATADPSKEAAAAGPDGSAPSPQVDFSGQWVLDVKASDSIDAMLTAIGLSIIERALVNNTTVTHIIHQTADEFTIEVKTAFFSRTDHLPLNGDPAQTTDPSGRPVESVTAWNDDARRLITKIWVPRDKQRFTMTRSLDEGHDTMEVLIEFFPKEGKSMTSRRVYRRVNSVAADKSS
jgi:hypothetical protein